MLERLHNHPHLYVNKVVRYNRNGKLYQATLIDYKSHKNGFFAKGIPEGETTFVPIHKIKHIDS